MVIRRIGENDLEALREYYFENDQHFAPWGQKRCYGYHAVAAWKQRLSKKLEYQNSGEAAFFICIEDGKVKAHCSLTQIVRGPFQACYMGYGVAMECEGKGYARKTCESAIEFAFDNLGLHRFMANYMPHNNRSGRLLKRLGFIREGYAKNYLKIQGKWADHVLTSLTNGAYT